MAFLQFGFCSNAIGEISRSIASRIDLDFDRCFDKALAGESLHVSLIRFHRLDEKTAARKSTDSHSILAQTEGKCPLARAVLKCSTNILTSYLT